MFCEAVAEAQGLKGAIRAATMLDLGHLVYVSVACLRLIQTYVCEAYPSLGESGTISIAFRFDHISRSSFADGTTVS